MQIGIDQLLANYQLAAVFKFYIYFLNAGFLWSQRSEAYFPGYKAHLPEFFCFKAVTYIYIKTPVFVQLYEFLKCHPPQYVFFDSKVNRTLVTWWKKKMQSHVTIKRQIPLASLASHPKFHQIRMPSHHKKLFRRI